VAAGAALPTMVNVAPRTGLVDLQKVTVAGKGFSPNVQIASVECRPGALAEPDCDLSTLVYRRSDAKGAFSFQRYVRRIISVGGKSVDCAAPAGCIMGAANIGNLKQANGRTIFFDPKVPAKVQKLTVSPRTNLVDHQLVTVSGSGFLPGSTVYLSQCVASSPPPSSPCDYATQRYVKVNGKGEFTSSQFALERRQIRYVKGGVKRIDCADAPFKCVIRAQASGIGSLNPPTVTLVFDPSKPPATATAQLSPATQLVDLQAVGVTGGGFTPGYGVGILQCLATGAKTLVGCDFSSIRTVTAGFHGEFSISYYVRRMISTNTPTGPAPVDCAASSGNCVLLLQGTPSQPVTTVPLDFDAAIPAVTPSVSASPDTGLADNQRIAVTLGGFTPDHPVQLVECTEEAVSEADLSYCDSATAIVTTPGGPTDQASFVVRSVVRAANGLEDCKSAPGACVLVAVGLSQYYGGYGGYAVASAVPHKVPLGSLPNTAATDLAFSP
jgi:Neocarzinostatin family